MTRGTTATSAIVSKSKKGPSPSRAWREQKLRGLFAEFLSKAKALGYSPQLEVGKPAPDRQAMTLSSLYLRPLDGSDQLVCPCCHSGHQLRMRSRTIPSYLPLAWCRACRQELLEGRTPQQVMELRAEGRLRGLAQLAAMSAARVRREIESWGTKYKRELAAALAGERDWQRDGSEVTP